MNASKSTLLRALQGLGHMALVLTVFEACSGDQASPPTPPAGPATLAISGIALGQGFVGDGGASSILGCDYRIGVNVQTTNWTLLPPARCGGALQCGQLRVSLIDGSSAELLTLVAAGNGVSLDVRSLLSATPPLQSGMYTIKGELVDDAGKAYVAVDGGNGSAQQEFFMELPADCTNQPPSLASGGTGGGSSGAGNAGDSAGGDSAGAGGDSAGAGAGAAGLAGAPGVEGA